MLVCANGYVYTIVGDSGSNWICNYNCNIKGVTGSTGPKGATGPVGATGAGATGMVPYDYDGDDGLTRLTEFG